MRILSGGFEAMDLLVLTESDGTQRVLDIGAHEYAEMILATYNEHGLRASGRRGKFGLTKGQMIRGLKRAIEIVEMSPDSEEVYRYK